MTHENDPFAVVEQDEDYSFQALLLRIQDGFEQLDALVQAGDDGLEYAPEKVYIVTPIVPIGPTLRFRVSRKDTGLVTASTYDTENNVPIYHFANITTDAPCTSLAARDEQSVEPQPDNQTETITASEPLNQKDEMLHITTIMDVVLEELRAGRASIKAYRQ